TIVLGRTPPLAQFLGEAMFFMKASTTSWILVGLTLLVASAFEPEALRRDTLAVLAPPATTASIPAAGDEFAGPFPSWTNLETVYRASGNGVDDDTAALQRALNELGTSGHSPVL